MAVLAHAEPLGGLLLSVVEQDQPFVTLRALRWHADLARLGVNVPLFVVADFGFLLALGPVRLRGRDIASLGSRWTQALKAYEHLAREISEAQVCVSASSMRLSDDVVVSILARLLTPMSRALGRPFALLPLDASLITDLESELLGMFVRVPRDSEFYAIAWLIEQRLRLLTDIDTIDVDTLRLLGMLGGDALSANAIAQVDILSVLSTPATNDVVNFSLELLPSILETRRALAATTHAAEGYAGLGTHGSLDSLVLSELAWDVEEFDRRLLEQELLYFTHEQAADRNRRIHCLLIDASASMRGERSVFARGVALALMKKMQLAGEDAMVRFFDSRLYEAHRVTRTSMPVLHVLGFKGERGRNPSRVFAQLVTELDLMKRRDHRDVVVHLITHGALHVPRPLITALRTLAHLFGVFIMPSGGDFELDYVDLLHGHHIVDYSAITEKTSRLRAANEVVDRATMH